METRSGEKYMDYIRQRNKVSKLTRQAQKDYEKTIAMEVKTNPKKFWWYVKSKTKSPSNIPDLYIDEDKPDKGLATEDSDKANILADFYSSVFTKEPPGPTPVPNRQSFTDTLRDTVFSEDRIRKKLTALKPSKSHGPHKLHPRILEEVAPAITKPLQVIFSTGTLPSI